MFHLARNRKEGRIMRWLCVLLVLPIALVVGTELACFAKEVDDTTIAYLRVKIKEDVLSEIRKEYTLVPKGETIVQQESNYVMEDEVRLLMEEIAEEMNFATTEWGEGLTFGGLAQRLTFQGFGDVTFRTNQGNGRLESEDSHFFQLGGLDLFFTSQISDHISFLSETLFEIGDDGNVLDIERLFIKYDIADYLQVAVGRVHTALGYWNQSFHHGSWLQTTIDRPDIYAFEDESGVLPIHAVGIELSGMYDFGSFDLEYTFNIANGRGNIVDSVQNISDSNDSKALGLMVTIRPSKFPGLFFGANFYVDDIPEKTDAPVHGEIDEFILGAHAGYLNGNWEFLIEGFSLDHDNDNTSAENFNTWGGYAQAAYRFDKIKPYYRFDIVQFDKGDSFFLTSFGETLSDVRRHTLGVRYDITAFNALKLEYDHRDESEGGSTDTFSINTSFSY